MAVEPYEDGFLLSEVPLGEGILDLKAMTAALRARVRAEGIANVFVFTRNALHHIPDFWKAIALQRLAIGCFADPCTPAYTCIRR